MMKKVAPLRMKKILRKDGENTSLSLFNVKELERREDVVDPNRRPRFDYYNLRISHAKVKTTLQKMGRTKAPKVYLEAVSLHAGFPKGMDMICLYFTSPYLALVGLGIVVVVVVVLIAEFQAQDRKDFSATLDPEAREDETNA
uniref:Uncharacterized protein n=1 Tax=Tanacetum cinerariifolium TaxID=118510 RepID=A0A699GT88_TANCI|nr:hypothetical protein [Tanacetum cinerariifolium]